MRFYAGFRYRWTRPDILPDIADILSDTFLPPLEGRGSVRMSCPKGVSEVSEGAKPNDGIVRKMEKPQ